MGKVYCGTGHRPDKLGGYSSQVDAALVELALDFLDGLEYPPDQVISGGALGWDTALAFAAFDLGIDVVMAIPFIGQDSRWPYNSRLRYRTMLKRAKSVHVVNVGGYSSYKMQRRNEWMVDHSDEVIALFDGSPGGTFNCVDYATRRGKIIHHLWDAWKEKTS